MKFLFSCRIPNDLCPLCKILCKIYDRYFEKYNNVLFLYMYEIAHGLFFFLIFFFRKHFFFFTSSLCFLNLWKQTDILGKSLTNFCLLISKIICQFSTNFRLNFSHRLVWFHNGHKNWIPCWSSAEWDKRGSFGRLFHAFSSTIIGLVTFKIPIFCCHLSPDKHGKFAPFQPPTQKHKNFWGLSWVALNKIEQMRRWAGGWVFSGRGGLPSSSTKTV